MTPVYVLVFVPVRVLPLVVLLSVLPHELPPPLLPPPLLPHQLLPPHDGGAATTETVRDTVPLFPARSTFRYCTTYVPTTPMFTEPDRANDPVAPYDPVSVAPEPSLLSVHDAPGSVNTLPTTTLMEAFPESITTGGIVSERVTTETVRDTVPLFPARSTFRYCTTYVPTTELLRVHDRANEPVHPYTPTNVLPEPSVSSVHDAPGSSKTVHLSRVNGFAPESVTTGGIVSVVSVTNTSRMTESRFPARSIFSYSMIYRHGVLELTDHDRVNEPSVPYDPVKVSPEPSVSSVHDAPGSVNV